MISTEVVFKITERNKYWRAGHAIRSGYSLLQGQTIKEIKWHLFDALTELDIHGE